MPEQNTSYLLIWTRSHKKDEVFGTGLHARSYDPSEIVDAYKNGADIVKIFPAGNLGTDYIKAIKGPLNFIPLAAVEESILKMPEVADVWLPNDCSRREPGRQKGNTGRRLPKD